jgi:KaiC/GvpD/RAD55 family RecA-like ATPase
MIKFGIPSVDFLLGYDVTVEGPQGPDKNKSLCIVGEPGTSKSLLALHLAATQAAVNPSHRVLYVSTDWSLDLAEEALKSFALGKKYLERKVDPYTNRTPQTCSYINAVKKKGVRLFCLDPSGNNFAENLKTFADNEKDYARIGFLDLKSDTAGDDWAQILRIVSLLPQLSKDKGFLIIVDAIEGIELLAGASDQFGQPRSRRQRIAQFARLIDKHHWALIIEDKGILKSEDSTVYSHYDEEFISDVVLRVGVRNVHGYEERYIQITKCRGSIHQLGQHPLLLRDGTGSRSDAGENADDPRVLCGGKTQSYIYAISSIHSKAAALLSSRKGSN